MSFSFLNHKIERGLTEDKETIPVVPGRHWEERERDPSTLGFCGTCRRGNSEQMPWVWLPLRMGLVSDVCWSRAAVLKLWPGPAAAALPENLLIKSF